MNETSATPPSEPPAAPAAAVATSSASASAAPSQSPPELPPPAAARRWSGQQLWMAIAVVALALSAWQWLETRQRLAKTQEELARRLAEEGAAVREIKAQAKESQELGNALQTRMGVVDAKLVEFQSQYAALEGMYQELARGRDEWALAEVEQLVTIAGQQLQLAGNVQAALLALSNADARLSRVERPYFLPLRKAIARDLERLRNLPYVDVPGISVKIEQMVVAADSLPVAYAERPRADAGRPAKAASTPPGKGSRPVDEPWWTRLAGETWNEVKGLVRIQRFDRPEPALLAPSHDFFLRENFKLRLLNARLALLAHDEATFRGELKLAQAWVERHFDARDKTVQSVQTTLKGLVSSDVAIDLPTLNESLAVLRTVKLGRERAAR